MTMSLNNKEKIMNNDTRLLQLAQKIEHTNLRPDMTSEDLRRLCTEAKQYSFSRICIPPNMIDDAKKIFAELKTSIPIATVIGFPLGFETTDLKVIAAHFSSGIGKASDIDMVMNISRFKSKQYDYVEREIKRVRAVVPGILKIIIETCYLTKKEITIASEIVERGGADYVKTSTGFGTRNIKEQNGSTGATVEDVRLIYDTVSDRMSIKASGGIKTFADALSMLNAGADRLGTSNSVAIMEEAQKHYEQKSAQ